MLKHIFRLVPRFVRSARTSAGVHGPGARSRWRSPLGRGVKPFGRRLRMSLSALTDSDAKSELSVSDDRAHLSRLERTSDAVDRTADDVGNSAALDIDDSRASP